MSISAQSSRRHFYKLDGLRGVAALIVAYNHCLQVLHLQTHPYFYLAVDFFFVLSGFVVGHAYDGQLSDRSLPLRKFTLVRLARLHPLLLLATAFGLALHLAMASAGDRRDPLLPILMAAVASAFCIPWHRLADPGAFPLNGPQWSLFAEYAANLLFAAVAPWLTSRRLILWLGVAGAMLIAMVANTGTMNRGPLLAEWPLSLVRVAFPFFAGVAIARLRHAGRLRRFGWPWWQQAGLLAIVLLSPALPLEAPLQLIAVMVLFPLIVTAGVTGREPERTGGMMMKWIGDVSYPLYMLHFPLVWALSLAAHRLLPPDLIWLAVPVQLAMALLLAHFALKHFDIPLRRALDPRRKSGAAPLAEQPTGG